MYMRFGIVVEYGRRFRTPIDRLSSWGRTESRRIAIELLLFRRPGKNGENLVDFLWGHDGLRSRTLVLDFIVPLERY